MLNNLINVFLILINNVQFYTCDVQQDDNDDDFNSYRNNLLPLLEEAANHQPLQFQFQSNVPVFVNIYIELLSLPT